KRYLLPLRAVRTRRKGPFVEGVARARRQARDSLRRACGEAGQIGRAACRVTALRREVQGEGGGCEAGQRRAAVLSYRDRIDGAGLVPGLIGRRAGCGFIGWQGEAGAKLAGAVGTSQRYLLPLRAVRTRRKRPLAEGVARARCQARDSLRRACGKAG